MSKDSAMSQKRLAGLPAGLRPGKTPREGSRYELVHGGPRHLGSMPFDYRNPFSPKETHDLFSAQFSAPQSDTAEQRGFDYFMNSNTAIGLPGGPECAIVDSMGTVRTYGGAWAFGPEEEGAPALLTGWSMADGRLPLMQARAAAPTHTWDAEFFAAEAPEVLLTEYPIEAAKNLKWVGGMEPRARNMIVGVGWRVRWTGMNPGGAAMRMSFHQAPGLPVCAGGDTQGIFSPAWESVECKPLGHGRYLLTALSGNQRYILALLVAQGWECDNGAPLCTHWPETAPGAPARSAAHGMALRGELREGETREFYWLIPYFPMPMAEAGAFAESAPRALRQSAARLWSTRRARDHIEIPEQKVHDAFLQSQNVMDMCTVRLDDSLFPTTAPAGQGRQVDGLEAPEIIHAYDLLGDHDQAAAMLEHIALDNVTHENAGAALWALGKHYSLTMNRDWLTGVWPEVQRRMTQLIVTWMSHRESNNGLLPPSVVTGGERVEGHLVSHHLYALAGIREASRMAHAQGRHALARQWDAFHGALQESVMQALEQLVGEMDGVIAPAFEGINASFAPQPGGANSPAGSYGKSGGGLDWLNLAAAYPTGVIEADHPWVTSSLARWGNAYVEGTFPYPLGGEFGLVNPALTLLLSETWLRAGYHAEAVRDLYGALLHTNEAHQAPHVADTERRLSREGMPSALFAARYARFLRNMLVHEDAGHRLHLLAGLAPAWLQPEGKLAVHGLPTELGPLSYRATMRDGGMDLDIDFRPRIGNESLVLHLPPFLTDIHVRTDGGHAEAVQGGPYVLPAHTRAMRVWWRREQPPEISFESVAAAYQRDYAMRMEGS